MDGYLHSGDGQFREIPGARIAWRNEIIEIAVPFRFFGAAENADIWVTHIRVYERVDLAYDENISAQSPKSHPIGGRQ